MNDPLPHFPMSPTDMKRWETAEASLAQLVNGSLSGEENVHAVRHAHARVQMPCWPCSYGNSLYDALGLLYLPYPYKDAKCYSCGIRLTYTVPFMSWPWPWFWSRPKDVTLDEIQKSVTRMYARDFPEKK